MHYDHKTLLEFFKELPLQNINSKIVLFNVVAMFFIFGLANLNKCSKTKANVFCNIRVSFLIKISGQFSDTYFKFGSQCEKKTILNKFTANYMNRLQNVASYVQILKNKCKHFY